MFVRVKTECAGVVKFGEFIDATALVIRDEIELKNDCNLLKLICKNNSRIAKDQVIARLYASENILNEDSEFFLSKFGSVEIENINRMSNTIIKKMIHNFNFDFSIKTLVKMHEKILNNRSDLEITQENPKKNVEFDVIKSDTNGIFSNYTDGFESSLNPGITDNEIKALNFDLYSKPQRVDSKAFGKIIRSKNCIVLCSFDPEKAINLEGKIFKIKFELNQDEMECEFLRFIDSDNGKKIAVFSSVVNDFFVNSRLENAQIKTKSVEGIKISKKSLRKQNNNFGVFILDRKIVKFRYVDILYEKGNFVVCHINDSDPNYLKENDLVITSGYHLYDGKILRL